jgi:hypothetical protein
MCQEVTLEDVKRVIRTYLVKLFDPNTSDVVCISAPTTLDSIKASFRDEGFNTILKSLEEFA